MKTPFLKTSMVTVLLAASALSMSQPAAAVQEIHISGNSCTPVGTNALIRTQFGPYQNSSANGIDVICPLTTDGQPWTQLSVSLRGYNRNAQDFISCSLQVTDQRGLQWGNILKVSLLGAVQEFQGQDNFTIVPNGNPPVTASNLSLTCHLPARTNLGFSHLTEVVVFK